LSEAIVVSGDGECTGFPEGIGPWNWHHCCVAHDAGGSDAQLTACVIEATALWFVPVVILAVLLMKAVRPFYVYGQRRGWWK
jgi:hypothetical protein